MKAVNFYEGWKVEYDKTHDKEYWQIQGNEWAEAWAQFGRIYYSNVPEVRRMLSILFPSFEKDAIEVLKRL